MGKYVEGGSASSARGRRFCRRGRSPQGKMRERTTRGLTADTGNGSRTSPRLSVNQSPSYSTPPPAERERETETEQSRAPSEGARMGRERGAERLWRGTTTASNQEGNGTGAQGQYTCGVVSCMGEGTWGGGPGASGGGDEKGKGQCHRSRFLPTASQLFCDYDMPINLATCANSEITLT